MPTIILIFSAVTEDNRETTFLFQRLSVALQRGNTRLTLYRLVRTKVSLHVRYNRIGNILSYFANIAY